MPTEHASIEEVRERIRKDGRPLREIARDANVAHSALVRFMNGTRSISFETACRLMEAVGLKIVKGRSKPSEKPSDGPELK
jgi:transcriptional regulator with XRE-family HTH domain